MKTISIIDAKHHVNEKIKIGVWLTNKRSSGKIAFLQLRDGSAYFQGVVVKNAVSEETFALAKEVKQETSLYVTGVIHEDKRSHFGYEIEIEEIEVVGESNEYPITPKEHGTDFLMDHRHLWLRSKKQFAIMQIRNEMIRATYEFFNKEGFIKLDAPILTGSAPEGTTELFHTEYFDRDAYLSQSGQLYEEAGAMAYGKVFSFGPTFRAEHSNTQRHAAEFWMIEPEIAFADLQDVMQLAQDLIKFIISYVMETCPDDLAFFNQFVDKGLLERLNHIVTSDFACISYTNAIEQLQNCGAEFEYPVAWGIDLQTEHERYLTEQIFKKPVFVTDYPKEIKAFYMRLNDDGKTVAAMDLLVPGIGEIIGGSQREERLDLLQTRMQEAGLKEEDYWWYLDLRRFGGTKHAGFGLGFERMVMYLTGISNIRDVLPFPRTTGNAEF